MRQPPRVPCQEGREGKKKKEKTAAAAHEITKTFHESLHINMMYTSPLTGLDFLGNVLTLHGFV